MALTEEQIAQNYTAMGHSVDLLNAEKPEAMARIETLETKVATLEAE